MEKKHLHKHRASQISFLAALSISFKVFLETFRGLIFLKKYSISTTFFGSARECLSDRYYRDAEKLAEELVKRDHSIITGGAFGIMGAGNKGAYNANGDSIGLAIDLPNEDSLNEHTTADIKFDYFSVRKMMLSVSSEFYVFFPGGYGTLDELFEVLTLIQTKKLPPRPIILYGKDYWDALDEFIKTKLLSEHSSISDGDECLYKVMDSPEEVAKYLDSLKITNMIIHSHHGNVELETS